FLFSRQIIREAVSVRRFMPDQFHERFRRSALHFEHHRFLERAEPFVDEEKRNEDRRDTDRNEPFVADVTWRMEGQAFAGKLVVKLFDERLEPGPFELQSELGNAALEQLLVRQ